MCGRDETFLMAFAFSPQHPAAHGVLRLILELNGEEILRADPVSDIRPQPASEKNSDCLSIAYWASPSWYGEANRVQNIHAGVTLL